MARIFAILMLLLLGSLSYAKQIICTEPPAWFDEPEIKFDLNDDEGYFKLIERTVILTSSDVGPEENIRVLADNMRCNFVGEAAFCTNKPDDKNNNFMYQFIWINPEFEQRVDDLLQTHAVIHPTRFHFAYRLGLKAGNKYFDAANCEIKF